MSPNQWDKIVGWVGAIGLFVYFIIVMNGGI